MTELERLNKYHKTPRGKAKLAWNRILCRLRTPERYPTYVGIECRMSRDEFIAWAVPEYELWGRTRPEEIPSVDRIRQDGHYEIGNIRLIELGENSARKPYNRHRQAPVGQAWCGQCRAYRPVADFAKSSRTVSGVQPYCRSCNTKYQRARRARGD